MYHFNVALSFTLTFTLLSCTPKASLLTTSEPALEEEIKTDYSKPPFGEECLTYVDGEFIFVQLEAFPQPLNGSRALLEDMYRNIRYPAEARNKGIEGTVMLSMIIDESGKAIDTIIEDDPGGGCGQAALQALEYALNLHSFTPGIFNGRPVMVKLFMSSHFRLD